MWQPVKYCVAKIIVMEVALSAAVMGRHDVEAFMQNTAIDQTTRLHIGHTVGCV